MVIVLVLLVVIAAIVVIVAAKKSSSQARTQHQGQGPIGPGWYPDHANPALVRWFDGYQWTHQTQPRH
ncbi:DUF2510 domain-containing protein [Nocardia sp. XZ_19_385]|uniref:DUF2510 domain-containing protein n=1 Tax=Nocardia sp. XZ_19_385 TaxID=2769488 RepID=UPI0035CCD93B